ncbi:MAG: hypothetical protein LBD63_00305, partial [Mycoplasmataceae bacterium]|nr:hypothetical protein [Mycoplasmataceae bacterium]
HWSIKASPNNINWDDYLNFSYIDINHWLLSFKNDTNPTVDFNLGVTLALSDASTSAHLQVKRSIITCTADPVNVSLSDDKNRQDNISTIRASILQGTLTGNWTLTNSVSADQTKFAIQDASAAETYINYVGGELSQNNETLTLTFTGNNQYHGLTSSVHIYITVGMSFVSLFPVNTFHCANTKLAPGPLFHYAMLKNVGVYDTYNANYQGDLINGIDFYLGASPTSSHWDLDYVYNATDESYTYTLNNNSTSYGKYLGNVTIKNLFALTEKLNLSDVFINNKPLTASTERGYNFYDLKGYSFSQVPTVADIKAVWESNGIGVKWQMQFQNVDFNQLQISDITNDNGGSVTLVPKADANDYQNGSVTFTNFSYHGG